MERKCAMISGHFFTYTNLNKNWLSLWCDSVVLYAAHFLKVMKLIKSQISIIIFNDRLYQKEIIIEI